ncbi:MAG: hypothetical protein MUD11_08060 [Rhodobacteraceae bacterium]|jgi:hypothetical protein|nr:hypothetical protein [Paracoccaceae bacterium]
MEKTLRLDPAIWALLERFAAEDDVSIGQIVRDALAREVRRRRPAKTSVRADERLVAPLRALLADDFAYARGWDDLQSRLHAKGFRLAEAGGGLVLQSVATGARICKGSELGFSYSALLRRFDCVFPGHTHSAALLRIRKH